jgi:curved DNA-binding protein CbpA
MKDLDQYSVLGVLPTADDIVIRAAYRTLAQRYHPDKWAGDEKIATEKMAEINAAHTVISVPIKCCEYGKTLSATGQAVMNDLRE